MSHQDRVFLSTFVGVLGFLVVLAVAFYFIAHSIGGGPEEQHRYAQGDVESRIAPVGEVNTGPAGAAPAPAAAQPVVAAAPRTGQTIIDTHCAACHATGAAGAPKIGDKAAWEQRLAQGLDTLVQHAETGIRAMPTKGTCVDCSKEELRSAIVTMLQKTGLEVAGAGATTAASDGASQEQPPVAAHAAAASPAPAAAGKAVAEQAAADASGEGENVFSTYCSACHATGVAGAPKFGDPEAWKPRIAQGMDTLVQHAEDGIRGMPPKGTCMTCTPEQIRDAVQYMVAHSE